jgi:hypothetical protein
MRAGAANKRQRRLAALVAIGLCRRPFVAPEHLAAGTLALGNAPVGEEGFGASCQGDNVGSGGNVRVRSAVYAIEGMLKFRPIRIVYCDFQEILPLFGAEFETNDGFDQHCHPSLVAI